MIIGNGDIASVLQDRDGLVFFASGVSNSKERRQSIYKREIDLLLKQDKSRHLVYFSSLCIFYSKTRYARHKKEMEELVKKNFYRYTIIRLGNISWGRNPHTLINYLRARVEKGKPLEVKNTFRYLIDKEEFLHWLNLIPQWSCEMNITGKRLKVEQIVKKYVYPKKRRDN